MIERMRPYKCYSDPKPHVERLEQKKEYMVALLTAVADGPGSPAAAVYPAWL